MACGSWHTPRGILVLRMFCRSCRVPWYSTAGWVGHQRSNSATQLGSVDSGPTTMKGPFTPLLRRWLSSPIVCTCSMHSSMCLPFAMLLICRHALAGCACQTCQRMHCCMT